MSKRVTQAYEFASLAKIVCNELRKSLGHSSFLDVKVKASAVPFPSTVDLVGRSEAGRNSAELSFDSYVLQKQISFVRALNSMIESALQA